MTKNELRRENAIREFVKIISDLKEAGYRYHHTALHRGYYAIDAVTVESYNGKFGEGYKIESHVDGTSRFHEVTYYVK